MASRLNTNFTAWTGVLTIKAGEKCSDAITRDMFQQTTVQCSENVIVEISNHPRPDTADDSTDWYDVGAESKFTYIYTCPFAWMRVRIPGASDKVATKDTDCYICSIPPSLN